MAIVVNGRTYRTLADEFFVNGAKVYEAYANGVKVYPEKPHGYVNTNTGKYATGYSVVHGEIFPYITRIDTSKTVCGFAYIYTDTSIPRTYFGISFVLDSEFTATITTGPGWDGSYDTRDTEVAQHQGRYIEFYSNNHYTYPMENVDYEYPYDCDLPIHRLNKYGWDNFIDFQERVYLDMDTSEYEITE